MSNFRNGSWGPFAIMCVLILIASVIIPWAESVFGATATLWGLLAILVALVAWIYYKLLR